MPKTILVLGATGTLGKPVSCALKEAGFQVRIMTRDLQKARKAFDNSFERIAGDLMNPACLEEALAGCYGVHISLPTEVEQPVAEMAAKLAPGHGIERITYISGATVAEEHRWFPMIERKFLAERAIRESGIPYTIFAPTWVMDGLPLFVNQGKAFVMGRQPYPYHAYSEFGIKKIIPKFCKSRIIYDRCIPERIFQTIHPLKGPHSWLRAFFVIEILFFSKLDHQKFGIILFHSFLSPYVP